MSRFIVTSGSHFNPFTYDELMKPVAQAQEVHNNIQDTYNNLETDTSTLDTYISKENDVKARELYDSYRNKLSNLQENLWKNGITASTKRDLSVARNAYASDIARLQAAIKNRQDRSKEYWDLKHNHPDMILSDDPGLSSLDNYLANDKYGTDYYSYSGNQFTEDVANDAKARAAELVRELGYDKTSIPGYITRIEQKGFTADEVNNATEAVRAFYNRGVDNADIPAETYLANLDEPSRLLADTLLSHVDSTGAADAVSNSELNRLIDYGRSGLSRSIQGPERKDFDDKVWDFNKKMQLATAKPNSGSGTEVPQNPTYVMNGSIEELKAPGYDKYASRVAGSYEPYQNGKKSITMPDGSLADFSSPWQAASTIFNPTIRQEARKAFGGLDVAMPLNSIGTIREQTGHIVDNEGKELTIKTRKISDSEKKDFGLSNSVDYGVYVVSDNGDLVISKQLTEDFSRAIQEYNEYVDKIRNANSTVNLDDIAISPSKEKKLREQYNIDNTVDSADLPAILEVINNHGHYSSVPLVSTESSSDYARTDFGRAMINSATERIAHKQMTSASDYAFYNIGEGGTVKSDKGETDLKKVFGENLNPGTISSITLSPFDIAKEAKPTVRFITTAAPDKVWSTDLSMLGTMTSSLTDAVVALEPTIANSPRISVVDAVKQMMLPFIDPQSVMKMSDTQAAAYSTQMNKYLKQSSAANLIPTMRNASGQTVYANVKDIVRDPMLRQQLYQAASTFLNDSVRGIFDTKNLSHAQHIGNTSTSAIGFIGE